MSRNTVVIAITNQKGGVGKTTISANIASGWARGVGPPDNNERILLIDLDGQSNATMVFMGSEAPQMEQTYESMGKLFEDEPPLEKMIQEIHLKENKRLGYQNGTLYLIPAHTSDLNIEQNLAIKSERERRLSYALSELYGKYDKIIIDCPPALGNVTLNALFAADVVFIPTEASVFGLKAVNAILLNVFATQKRRMNPRSGLAQGPRVGGFILNFMDPTLESAGILEKLEALAVDKRVGGKVLSPIPRAVALKRASGYAVDVFSFSDKATNQADTAVEQLDKVCKEAYRIVEEAKESTVRR